VVRYHYALVDDLVSREEFDRLIGKKISDCGNLADEVAAALLVVKDLGRSHVKIKNLHGKSSLFCFYAKIIAFSGAKEFDRPDGEKGLVARLTVADETGQTTLVFWDDQAAALEETFEIGDVVEVIGRHGRSMHEILPLNLRKSIVDIDCVMTVRERKPPQRADLLFLVINLSPPKSYTRRDGTGGEMISGLIGDSSGTARLTCWEPAVLAGISRGTVLSASGVLIKEGDYGGREVIIDGETVIMPADTVPDIPVTMLSDLLPDQNVTVRGKIISTLQARSFIRRDGTVSWVKNLRISDGSLELPLVLWDNEAKRPLLPGDSVIIYHARTKTGRTGDTEISPGKNGVLMVIPGEGGERVRIKGTILCVPDGTVLTNEDGSWLVETTLPHGTPVEISGLMVGNRLFCESEEVCEYNPDEVKEQLKSLLSSICQG